MTGYGLRHRPRTGCHPLIGKYVEVVDVKRRADLDLCGRRGVIRHDPTFGGDYLSFEDGGSVDPDVVIVERR